MLHSWLLLYMLPPNPTNICLLDLSYTSFLTIHHMPLKAPSLKVFHKSGSSVLTISFTLFSNFTLVRFSFNFHILFMISSFLTIIFRTFLSRFTATSLCCSSHGITFTFHTILSSPQASNQFLLYIYL